MKTSAGRDYRRSVRIRNFDYASDTRFFVTICAKNRKCIFGRIVDGLPVLSDIGRIVEEEWLRTPLVRPGVMMGRHVVMPNHFHCTVFVPDRGEPMSKAPRQPRSLGSLIGGFKSKVTSRVRKMLRDDHYDPWQPRFHDEAIRTEKRLEEILRYISENPEHWAEDPEYEPE